MEMGDVEERRGSSLVGCGFWWGVVGEGGEEVVVVGGGLEGRTHSLERLE